MVEPLVKVDLTDQVTLKCDTKTATVVTSSYKSIYRFVSPQEMGLGVVTS